MKRTVKSKGKTAENYLERIPVRNPELGFEKDEKGIVTLSKENKGIANRIAQKLLKKPKVSYIHLDEFGSFVWLLIDGESDIIKIGESVKEHFGDKAEPLYERLAKYFGILASYGFVTFKSEK